MKFAVNYSRLAAKLVHEKKIQIDFFKCPSSPGLIATAQETCPVYVHFSFKVGRGIGDAIDADTNQPVDWKNAEALLLQTGTPFVSLHLGPTAQDCPDIPPDTADPGHIEVLTERMIRDVGAVVERLGPERVVVENLYNKRGRHFPRPIILPDVISRVVQETGCGFLFDVSHARLAAHDLDMNARKYIDMLPTEYTREIHVTGIQCFEGRWISLARQFGVDDNVIQRFSGCLMDHMPLTEADWDFFAWSLEQIRDGVWGQPWIVTFEYGADNGLSGAVTELNVLLEQVPRLYALVQKTL